MLNTQEPKYDVANGRIVNRDSGEAIPDDEPVFIFRARDVHAVDALHGYLMHVMDAHHMGCVSRRIDDFKRFAAEHPDRMKEPDTASSNAEAQPTVAPAQRPE